MVQPDSTPSQIAAVKVPTILIMFLEVIIFGSLPLRLKAFKENKLVLALAAAFSGGLFLAIGLVHLLPECNEDFDKYFESLAVDGEENPNVEHFPWAFFVSALSFAFILLIEKVLVGEHHDHDKEAKNKSKLDDAQNQLLIDGNLRKSLLKASVAVSDGLQGTHLIAASAVCNQEHDHTEDELGEPRDEEEDQLIKTQVSNKTKLATKVSMAGKLRKQAESMANQKESMLLMEQAGSPWAPYILQIAVGIHAVFEGMAIGLEKNWVQALMIAVAVVCHKWAEGLTLGIAFRKAGVDLKTSTIMIFIQAAMNPIGIGIGWGLSGGGLLIQGIFDSVSVGTFLYISTMEVLVEEFNIQRYKWLKYFVFLLGIAFVCFLFLIELATKPEE